MDVVKIGLNASFLILLAFFDCDSEQAEPMEGRFFELVSDFQVVVTGFRTVFAKNLLRFLAKTG